MQKRKLMYVLIASAMAFFVGCSNNIGDTNSNNPSDSSNSEHQHVFGDVYTFVNYPTLTEKGSATHVCSFDNEVEVVEVAELSNNSVWTKTTVKEPTHIANGQDKYTSIYGEIILEVEKISHTFGDTYTFISKPTLTEKGSAIKLCTENDGGYEQVEVPSLSDTATWTSVETKPTHTEDGYITYSSIYGEVILEGEKAEGHHFSSSYRVGSVSLGEKATLVRNCDTEGCDEVEEKEAKAPAGYPVSIKSMDELEQYFNITKGDGDLGFSNYENGSGVVGIKNSNSGKGGTIAYIKLVAKEEGTFSFDYESQGEKGYDYFSVHKNAENYESTDAIESSFSFTSEESHFGHVSIKLNKGDFAYISYRKDGSGDKGFDGIHITNMTMTSKNAQVPTNAEFEIVYFDTGCDIEVMPSVVFKGEKLTNNPSLSRTGFEFEGWYLDSNYEVEYIDQAINNDQTIYAKWFDLSNESPLKGSYKGMSLSTDSSGEDYVLYNVDMDINYKGVITRGPSSIVNKRIKYDENKLEGTIEDYVFKYDADYDCYMVYKASMESSSSFYVFTKGDNDFSSSTVKNLFTNSGAYRICSFSEEKSLFIDTVNNQVYKDITLVSIRGKELKVTDLISDEASTIFGFEVVVNEDRVATFGHSSEGWNYNEDSSLYGEFTCNEDILYINGQGYFQMNNNTSKIKYYLPTEGETYSFYAYDSSSYYYEITLNEVDKTYTLNDVKKTVSFVLGDKVDQIDELEFAKYSWIHISDLPKLELSKDGKYLFDGWYFDSEYTSPYKSTKVTEDMVVYAKWTKAISVKLNYNDGEEPIVLIFKENETISLPTPTRKDYIFKGWFVDEALEVEAPTSSSEDFEVFAKWEEAPLFVGEAFVGTNIYGRSSTSFGVKQESGKGESYCYYEFLPTGEYLSGYSHASSTYSLENYDSKTRILKYSSNNYLFGFYESKDGQVFGVTSSSAKCVCEDDFYLYVKGASVGSLSYDFIYWGEDMYKIVELTYNQKQYYFFFEGYSYSHQTGGKVYIDVTFSDFNGNPLSYSQLCQNNVLTSELVIHDSEGNNIITLGGSSNGFVENDGKEGSYNSSIDGINVTVELNGFATARVIYSDEVVVIGTYKVNAEGNITLTTDKARTFEVSGNNLTQVLDGVQGTYGLPDGKSLVLTGWGVCNIESNSGTYEINGDVIVVTIDGVVKNYYINKESMTASENQVFVGTFVAVYKFTCNNSTSWYATTKFIFSNNGNCNVTSTAADHDDYDYGCSSDYYSPNFTGTYTYTISDNTITLVKNSNRIVLLLAEDGNSLTISSSVITTSNLHKLPNSSVVFTKQ
ncbi:MAG: InlB B-repeat-containing protein [Bacillales bacterium]|nr:InlB B-repeat-containing protein [Bacillales bacterium]